MFKLLRKRTIQRPFIRTICMCLVDMTAKRIIIRSLSLTFNKNVGVYWNWKMRQTDEMVIQKL